MQTINFPRADIQAEQFSDMEWACAVLAGMGEPGDCPEVATGMLETLAAHGACELVRRAAAGALGAVPSDGCGRLH